MANALNNKGKFGTAPVFLTAISTILGAIMFLRFGYAVGAVGILGTMLIVVIGHLVTIPTALSLAEIATNQKVEGGGEYFVISRSFGLSIGAAVGIALYLSQAVSVAFYIIAFAESFAPLMDYVNEQYGLWIHIESTKKLIGIIVTLLLALLMTTKGANFGMGLLYIVVGILALVLILFFMGTSIHAGHVPFKVLSNDDFFKVFAIIFPAFTGMTAGVGLSGDLKDPKRSIPLGTIMATVLGMIIYLFITLKIGNSATPEILMSNENQLIMSDIALIGYLMIPIGLAASTISSALGSIMVAPRTLNAIAADKIIPSQRLNRWLAFLKKENNEPTHAAIVTSTIAFVFVFLGDVDVVAKIISMFFMVTYGALNLISLLENFAANPGYRPAFKSKWYISLIGTIMCIWLMFKMNPGYAFLSIVIMIGIYFLLNRHQKKSDLASIFSGVIFQISRNINVFLQKVNKGEE
ncbi:MAG: amino acid permease, partial [Bacteroidota bacterium]|nr:amino acid permease [Bacteroidota bacterium]